MSFNAKPAFQIFVIKNRRAVFSLQQVEKLFEEILFFMSKNLQNLARSFAFAFIVLVVGSYVIVAQTAVISGDWTAEMKTGNKNGKIQLSFEWRTEKGGRNTMGQSYAFDELQGLSKEQANGTGAVKFSFVREAGNIDCEGAFQSGKGAGTFRFAPNGNFVSAMKARGFDFNEPSNKSRSLRFNQNDSIEANQRLEERLFAAATLNLTTAFTDDLLAANFGKLDIDDLFKAKIFDITPQFMSEMKAVGFPNLDMEDLVKARIFKVDADYVRQVREMNFKNADMEAMTKLRIFKVTPEFIREVQAEGLPDLSIEELVKMKIFKIDAAFIRQAKADNVPLEIEKLVQRRIGVR